VQLLASAAVVEEVLLHSAFGNRGMLEALRPAAGTLKVLDIKGPVSFMTLAGRPRINQMHDTPWPSKSGVSMRKTQRRFIQQRAHVSSHYIISRSSTLRSAVPTHFLTLVFEPDNRPVKLDKSGLVFSLPRAVILELRPRNAAA
jgi:hypothetical protein